MADLLVDARRHNVLPMVELEGRAVCMPCPCSGLESGPKSESSPGLEKAPGPMRCPSETCLTLRCGDEGDGTALLETPSEKCPAGGLVHWDGKDSLHESGLSAKKKNLTSFGQPTILIICANHSNGTDRSL